MLHRVPKFKHDSDTPIQVTVPYASVLLPKNANVSIDGNVSTVGAHFDDMPDTGLSTPPYSGSNVGGENDKYFDHSDSSFDYPLSTASF